MGDVAAEIGTGRAALFDALVDDAALFPPGNASMHLAVSGHFRHGAAPYARILGRFLCAASRLPECAAEFRFGDNRMNVGIVVDNGPAGVAAALDFTARTHKLIAQAVEMPLPRGEPPAKAARQVVAVLPAGLPAYVEVPRERGWEKALDVLAQAGRYAKLRTGGTVPEAFPPSAGVAAFVRACAERGLPFKCTAGLHHAVRWEDPYLGWNHGFLNVLGAVHAALGGASTGDVVDVLERTAADEAVAGLPRTGEEVAAARRAFHGFGSCSIVEPATDLERLGLL